MKRKFLYFTDEELGVLVKALEQGGAETLLKQAKDEVESRELGRQLMERIKSHQPKAYAC